MRIIYDPGDCIINFEAYKQNNVPSIAQTETNTMKRGIIAAACTLLVAVCTGEVHSACTNFETRRQLSGSVRDREYADMDPETRMFAYLEDSAIAERQKFKGVGYLPGAAGFTFDKKALKGVPIQTGSNGFTFEV